MEQEQIDRLQELIKTMDLPAARVDVSKPENIRWLSRNMGIRNCGNDNYAEARKIIVSILKASL